MSLKWDFCTLADHLGRAVQAAEEDLRLEQAVYGLDARDERSLQALLAGRLMRDYEVAREVHYPSTKGKKLSHRQRCDLVLSPKGRPLRLDHAPPTLFDAPAIAEVSVDWWADAFLVASPDALMTPVITPLAAFRWGYEISADGVVKSRPPRPRNTAEAWAEVRPEIQSRHPAWTFQ